MFKDLIAIFGAWVLVWIACVAAWITHIVWCIQNREFLFMIAAGLIAPLGMIHGFCLWLGFTWV